MSTTLPDIRLARLEETEDWDESITSRTGKLWGVYLFDATRHVYCCEMTPSYELHHQGTAYERNPEDERESDRLNIEVMEGDAYTERVMYVHTHAIAADTCEKMDDLTPETWAEQIAEHDDDEEQALDALLEQIGEYVRCSGYVY